MKEDKSVWKKSRRERENVVLGIDHIVNHGLSLRGREKDTYKGCLPPEEEVEYSKVHTQPMHNSQYCKTADLFKRNRGESIDKLLLHSSLWMKLVLPSKLVSGEEI